MSVYVEKTMKSGKKNHQIHEISTNLAIYVKSVHWKILSIVERN